MTDQEAAPNRRQSLTYIIALSCACTYNKTSRSISQNLIIVQSSKASSFPSLMKNSHTHTDSQAMPFLQASSVISATQTWLQISIADRFPFFRFFSEYTLDRLGLLFRWDYDAQRAGSSAARWFRCSLASIMRMET